MSKKITVIQEIELEENDYEYIKSIFDNYGTQDALVILNSWIPHNKKYKIILDNEAMGMI